ncbi:HCL600Wp [Eremothecium sinecaudum]|uniref:Ubiquitin fusion degradation protein 1 n=1 Tax=Eremothecium sinecaudum TaxID=45286 RepID=A0A109UVX9_9SACH|nr:HCL600Wp [Eremothecium sinecaudum]AMD19551.1 HCL600Wp [Eremothecium sinecaudum]
MFTGFGAFGGIAAIPQKFEDFFRCYPMAMMNDRIRKDDANYGGKIFLPPSALNKLSMLNIQYPMLFRLSSEETGKVTNGGVLEFIAEEGRAYLPNWMMETLGVQPGSLLQIGSTDIAQGHFVKLEPQSVDFLDISDPKAVLENVLRRFSTLTVNDIIEISYNNKIYRIKVLEVKPETQSQSICVIETDLVTDFAPPVGYVEPDYEVLKAQQTAARKHDAANQKPGTMSRRIKYAEKVREYDSAKSLFDGEGQKLSGKPVTKKDVATKNVRNISLDGPPAPLLLEEGQLFFGFPIVLPKEDDEEDGEPSESKPHFQTQGQSLRQRNKRKGKKDHDVQRSKAPKSPEVIQID